MKNAAERYLLETAEMAHRMRLLVRKHPHALLFASVHGSKLHGFDTPDSDRDIRGCHVLPLEIVTGLAGGPESIRRKDDQGTPGVELATHDVKKVLRHAAQPQRQPSGGSFLALGVGDRPLP